MEATASPPLQPCCRIANMHKHVMHHISRGLEQGSGTSLCTPPAAPPALPSLPGTPASPSAPPSEGRPFLCTAPCTLSAAFPECTTVRSTCLPVSSEAQRGLICWHLWSCECVDTSPEAAAAAAEMRLVSWPGSLTVSPVGILLDLGYDLHWSPRELSA